MKRRVWATDKWVDGKKPCTLCGEWKGPDDFFANKNASDGKRPFCKLCTRARNLAWERANPEKHLDMKRRYVERTRERTSARQRRWHEAHRAEVSQRSRRRTVTHPHQHAAHVAVRSALRNGKLARPILCEGCGEPKPLHGHHDDYSKPLDVNWLCVGCHNKRHALARRTG